MHRDASRPKQAIDGRKTFTFSDLQPCRPLPGTSTLLSDALLSAHYGPLRHPSRPGLALPSWQLRPTAITAGASRVASGLLCLHAIAITPAGPMELVRSSLSIVSGLPGETVRSG